MLSRCTYKQDKSAFHEPRWLATVCIAFALAISTIVPSPARAEEGDGEQIRETLGPYEIGVTISQSTGSVGPVHLIITLLNATTRQPVPDAKVRIRTRNEEDGTGGWALALNKSEGRRTLRGKCKP